MSRNNDDKVEANKLINIYRSVNIQHQIQAPKQYTYVILYIHSFDHSCMHTWIHLFLHFTHLLLLQTATLDNDDDDDPSSNIHHQRIYKFFSLLTP